MDSKDPAPAPNKSADKFKSHRFSLAKKTNPLQLNDLQILNGEAVLKIVLVGDNACGKTQLLLLSSKDSVPSSYIPTVFEDYSIRCTVASVPFHMVSWDTAGQQDYDRLRPLSYTDAHVICICFSVNDAASFEHVKTKWAPEIAHFNRDIGAATFLLGFRETPGREGMAREGIVEEGMQGDISEQGTKLAAEIGAQKFIECELTKEGVSHVFPTILGMVLEASPGLKMRFPAPLE